MEAKGIRAQRPRPLTRRWLLHLGAVISCGARAGGVLATNAPTQYIGVGWMPASSNKTFVVLGDGHDVCLVAGAPQPDATFGFMRYLTTPEANQIIFDSVGWVGFNKNVAAQTDVTHLPNMRFVLDAPAKVQRLLAPVVLPIDTTPVDDGVQQVIDQHQSTSDMLKQASQQLQAQLDQALKQG